MQIPQIPRYRLYAYGLIGLLVAAYCFWLVLHKPDVEPGQTVTAPPAKVVKNEPQTAIRPKQVIVYRDTTRVVEKLGLTHPSPYERVQTTAEIPKLKHGGTSATFLNVSTGQSRTEIKANQAPWIAFKRDLAVGAGVGIGSQGNTASIRTRYDVLQIKELTFSGEIEANYAEQRNRPIEGRAMIWMEWRP